MSRQPSLLVPPIGFAHRGARAHAPENTLDAFALAVRLGATGLESDVWVTADGEVVLDHDGVVRSGVRRRRIGDVARADLPAHIPTLAQLYEHVGTDLPLSLDVKDGAAADGVVAVARNAGALEGLWLCSPSWEEAARWKQRWPDVKAVDSTRKSKVKEGLERRGALLDDAGIDALNMHWTDWSTGHVSLVHRFGIVAFAWDCQHRRQLDAMLEKGIDAVYSDHVDRMVDALEGRPDRS